MSEVLHRLATKEAVDALTAAVEALPNATQEAADNANEAAETANEAAESLRNVLNLTDILSTGTVETGKFVSGRDGTYSENITCDIVKDIDVSGSAEAQITILYYSYYYAGFAFYNSSHQYISGSKDYNYNKDFSETVQVPKNAKYLTITVKTTSVSDYSVLTYATSPLSDVKLIHDTLGRLSPRDVKVFDYMELSGQQTSGKAWNINGTPTSGANYNYSVFEIPEGAVESVMVSGASWGTSWPLITFYDEDDTLIGSYGTAGSTIWANEIVPLPESTAYAVVNGSTLAGSVKAPALSYYGDTGETQEDVNNDHLRKICTLQDAFVAWMHGEKFPIAFFGDSTTDGWRTTGWTENVLGSDHMTGYLYTDVLQRHLRACCNNSVLRIYNAGFTGHTLAWGLNNFSAEFLSSEAAYADVKMIGISFGINDSIETKAEYAAFKSTLIAMIRKCLANNIQPFLLTTQATYEADPASRNEAIANHSYANQIKKEVAKQYNLELIDTEKYTARFITMSQEKLLDIIPDTCHFGDAGHNFEGGMYFWQMVPRTIYADESGMIVTPYTMGVTSDLAWRDGNYNMLYANSQGSNKFKTYIEKSRESTDDIKILDTWVYFNKPMSIVPFFGTLGSQHVVVDDVNYVPSADDTSIGTFDMGLHHIVLMSGTDATIRCYGYTLG